MLSEGVPRVIVLGASRYNMPVIGAIAKAGFFVVAADGNDSAPGFEAAHVAVVVDIRDPIALRSVAEKYAPIDGIVTLGEAGVRPAAAVCAQLGLPSISEGAAQKVTSKVAMRRAWDSIPQFNIPWQAVHDEAEAIAAVTNIGGYPVIVKPDRTHGGSRGVSRADNRQELVQGYAHARTMGFSNDVVIERFIVSRSEHSAEVLIHNGKTSMLCIGQKVKTCPPYRVDLSVRYPASLAKGEEQQVRRMCSEAINALGLTRGAAHVEFAYTDDGPRLLEIGARCGGGHTPLLAKHMSGVDEIVEVCRMACGIEPGAIDAFQRRGGDYRFLVFPDGVFAEAIIPDEVRNHPDICDVGVTLAPGGQLCAIQNTSNRAGFVVTFADDAADAVRLAEWAQSRIVVRYADGREESAIPIDSLAGL